MSSPAIRVENLSKVYRIGLKEERPETLFGALVGFAKAPFENYRRLRALSHFSEDELDAQDVVWALRDVSFEVEEGEVLGLIGANGAGKSTLLKILAGITEPSHGRAILHGRVASLLEVGTGFHPDLTGRENIYLNGTLLGMKKAEIDAKLDEIIGFSGVERFIDTPVKRYSSGMKVRLAFAVAAHLEPEILVVDEVLAVGDAAFQKKCLGRMGVVAGEGRSVLFVSHNMAAVQQLCRRVVVLEDGRPTFMGPTRDGIDRYLRVDKAAPTSDIDLRRHPNRPLGRTPVLRRFQVLDNKGQPKALLRSGEPLTFVFHIEPSEEIQKPVFGIGINALSGVRLFSLLSNNEQGIPHVFAKTTCRVLCTVEQLPLAPGRYTLSLSVGTEEAGHIDNIENAVEIRVVAGDFYGTGRTALAQHGAVLVRSQWSAVTY